MKALILKDDEQKDTYGGYMLQNGYALSEFPDLYVRGSEEVLLLLKNMLHVKETLFLDFLPQPMCELTKYESDVVDFIRLRHMSTISVETNPKEVILHQLFT